MRYKSPKNLLLELANGSSAGTTKTAALKLLELGPPDAWPKFNRRSKENAMKRLACNPKVSAKKRLAAYRACLHGISLTAQDALNEEKT